jgi:peroxiredoxin
VRLVAVSADRPQKLRETLEEKQLDYALLSDATAQGARAFGIAWQVGAAELLALRGFGIDLEDASGQSHHILPVPSVFLVDADGVVRFVYSNPDYKVRLENERLLEAARALVAR